MMSTMTVPSKTRSPNYPSISLGEAVDRLKRIYDTQRQYPATREVLAKLMGYGSLNGASAAVVSALSKYGLLEGHGDNLRVSGMGQDLILHRKGDPEYTIALQTAAFMPGFFREMRDQYPHGLPSEHSLRATLIKRGFNSKAIDGAVRAYRDTIEFIDVETGGMGESALEGLSREGPSQGQATYPTSGRPPLSLSSNETGQSVVTIPLAVGKWATLQAEFPLTETAWEQMITVLTAMKPALVAMDEQSQVSAIGEKTSSGQTTERVDDQ